MPPPGPPGRPPPGPPGGRPPPGKPPGGPPPPPGPKFIGFGFFWFAVTAVVTITLSPTTMGDDHATPGISTFHATFLSLPHSVGSFDSLLRAAAPGPRNCGQSSAHAAAGTASRHPRA